MLVVDANLAKDGCSPLSPPVLVRHFEILCRPYRQWLPIYLRARFASITLYTLGPSAISDIALMRIAVGDTARLRLNFVFQEFSFGSYPNKLKDAFADL